MEKDKQARESLEASYAEMNKLRIEEKKNQLNTEFQRYKQDCRKRALDLAHARYSDWFTTNKKPFIGDEPKTEGVTTAPDIIDIANEYYNWLISIPETK